MRFLCMFIRYLLLVVLCLWLVAPCLSSGSDVLCLSGENEPRLRRRNDNFSIRAVAEKAQARAYLSPAAFLGTLRSVLVQRDGTVRAWFSVDDPLKMPNDTDITTRRRRAHASRVANYTRIAYSRNRYARDYVSLPAFRPRDFSSFPSMYTRSSSTFQTPSSLPNWTVPRKPLVLSTFKRSTRNTLNKRPEDTEVVYYRSGSCVLEVNQDNLKLGSQYLVFGVPAKRHPWPSMTASALPIPNEKRTLRAVKRVLCNGCGE